jgi:hypothetical protein
MVIMRDYFNFSRRDLLGSALAAIAIWPIAGLDFAVAAPSAAPPPPSR